MKTTEENYLESVKKQLAYYKKLGDKTFDQLTEKELLWQYNAESNSIAIIVNHLWGNMKSRWTDFLTSDGEKTWRKRDMEFESVIRTGEELQEKWEDGWECVFKAVNSVDKNNFNTPVYIRNEAHTIMDAINRQMAHYAYHIGQIVFIAKMLKGAHWKSLTIPKGKSGEFNREKFSKGKH